MSEQQQNDEVQRIQRRFGVSRDQASAMYQESLRLSQRQLERALVATGNFVTTVVALISSAVGFVAAFAWNDAFQTYLSTNGLFNVQNTTEKKFIYAIIATVFAVVVIAILGFINSRIKGRNLIPTNNS